MRRPSSRMGLILLGAVLAVVALAATAAAQTRSAHASPIIIGWAYDGSKAGPMAPFDGPALAAATAPGRAGEREGRRRRPADADHHLQHAGRQSGDVSKACALKLIGEHANIIFTTCDVDLAAPVVQEAINRGILAVAPCIGTDQMGPKRFGPKGKLAFSFGNVAQDEGSAMAQYAWGRGWKTAALATDNVIVYFKNITAAFAVRFKQLGGKIVDSGDVPGSGLPRQQRRERRQPAQQRQGGRDRDVDRRCVRGARADDHGSADARQQHADPQLVGR